MLRIESIIIIGAPSCAGKTYLIEKIKKGDCPHLCEQLGIFNISLWRFMNVSDVKNMHQPIFKRLVVHYDLYVQYSQDDGFKYLDELIKKSDKVIILTLNVEKSLLIKRNNIRILKATSGLILRKEVSRVIVLKRIVKMLMLTKLYKRGFSEFLYERWFNYLLCSDIKNHWLINSNNSNAVVVKRWGTSE